MSDVRFEQESDIHPILKATRAYAFAYTANHDFSVCSSIMTDDYELRMGEHRVTGRDTEYRQVTQRQFDQFPGLGFTIHDVVSNGERVALRFSEHGRSIYRDSLCVWGGVSLYRWDGSRLTSCLVEQDYFARRRQLASGRPNPVESPAIDPWSSQIEPTSPESEQELREWVLSGGIEVSTRGTLDDEWCSPEQRYAFDARETVFNDVFSAGNRVAFHVTQSGELLRPASNFEDDKVACVRHAAGIAVITRGSVNARIVTDRIEISKFLEEVRSTD